MEEQTSITFIACTLILCAFSCITSGCYMSEKTRQEAIKAGLHEQSVPGQSMRAWVRPAAE